jgi:hypothetical protein
MGQVATFSYSMSMASTTAARLSARVSVSAR